VRSFRSCGLLTRKAWGALAVVAGDSVVTNAPVFTRRRFTIIDVDLTAAAGEAGGTRATIPIDEIVAGTSVHAGVWITFVDIDFALVARETCGTDQTLITTHTTQSKIHEDDT